MRFSRYVFTDGNFVFMLKPFYVLMSSYVWFDAINLGWSIVFIKGLQVMLSKKNKEEGKDQESILSSTTPESGHRMEK